MDYPSVFLVRFSHRSWGFMIVAVVERDEESALEQCCAKYGCQTTDKGKRGYATVVDQCSIAAIGNMAAFEFSE